MLTKPLLESVSKFPSDEFLRQLAGAEDGFDLNRLRQVRRFKQARDAFDGVGFGKSSVGVITGTRAPICPPDGEIHPTSQMTVSGGNASTN